MSRVIVGMSGGVDSSVSAWLLQQQGHEVIGVFMKNWDEDDGSDACTALRDLADAQAVCDRLGIPLQTINFASEYWDRVFEYFLASYRAGLTPNPDILCNKEIKFRAFLDYARALGGDYIATGHYARRNEAAGAARLLRGLDANKDQSYFLHAVSGDALARSLFPVGGMCKTEVRQIAYRLGLATAGKKDSTGICFIGERRFREFLQRYLPAQPGPMLSTSGQVLGEHLGLMYYTEGQRQGLGIGGQGQGDERAWYVLHKDLARNALIVGQGSQHPGLYASTLWLQEIAWVRDIPSLPLTLTAKIRYRQADQTCRLHAEDGRYRVDFMQPQRAISPGQSIVFYQDEVCLGGGVICARDESFFHALSLES